VDSIDGSAMYRVITVDHAHGTGNDYFVAAELGRDFANNEFILNLARSNTWNLPQRVDAVLKMLRYRKPNRLAIEKTSESLSFIELLVERINDAGLYVKIETPTAASKGNKEEHILTMWEPRLQSGKLFALKAHADFVNSELTSFGIDNKANHDDILDACAVGMGFLKTPERESAPRPVKTGDPFHDNVILRIHRAKHRVSRTSALTGGW